MGARPYCGFPSPIALQSPAGKKGDSLSVVAHRGGATLPLRMSDNQVQIEFEESSLEAALVNVRE